MAHPTTTSRGPFKPIQLALPTVSPSLVVAVLPYGFTLHRIHVNGDGKTHDLIIGPEQPEEHGASRRFLNTIVGRYSNRIPTGEFTLEKDGLTSHLSVGPTTPEFPGVQLHGGPDGFDARTFEVVDPWKNPKGYALFSEAEKDAITTLSSGTIPSAAIFKLRSPAGDQGYPGTLDVEVLLAVVEPGTAPKSSNTEETELGSLLIVYRARLDAAEPKTVTPVNLTQHWGFNLDASLGSAERATPDVKEHELTIKAANTIALNADSLATGELDPTAGTHHYHDSKAIGERFPDKGYDSFYMIDGPAVSPYHIPQSSFASLDVVGPLLRSTDTVSEPPVTLSSSKSGIRVTFETNQPGVQFYTGNGLDGEGSRKYIHGGAQSPKEGDGYQPQAGAFLEFHEPLAAWLHPWGKDGNDTLLTSGNIYNNYTKMNVYFKHTDAC